MSLVSHELEQMMRKFFSVSDTSETLVTTSNGYSIKYFQCSPSNASQLESLNVSDV